MLTRREMIEAVLAFSAWPSLRPTAATASPQMTNAAAPDDEVFWAQVRSQFEIIPEVANLVSVVRGNFTKANREISFSEATRLNRGLLRFRIRTSSGKSERRPQDSLEHPRRT